MGTQGIALRLYATPDAFGRWLDGELSRRSGRRASNRSICIRAGLPENALYRVLTQGERPGARFIERMASHLDLQPAEVERHAGLRPLLDIGAGGAVEGATSLS